MDRKTFFFGLVAGAVLVLAVIMLLREVHSVEVRDIGLRVTQIADGDTITVDMPSGGRETVRFVGIDAPEVPHPGKKGECYGTEATLRLKELLKEKRVSLVKKPNEDRDTFGRLLRYVSVDGNDIGAELLKEGFAKSYCYKYPHERCAEYERLESEAKEKGLGMWSCGR